MPTDIANDAHNNALTADERWAAWVARGAKQDRQMTKVAQVAFPLVGALVVLVLFLLR